MERQHRLEDASSGPRCHSSRPRRSRASRTTSSHVRPSVSLSARPQRGRHLLVARLRRGFDHRRRRPARQPRRTAAMSRRDAATLGGRGTDDRPPALRQRRPLRPAAPSTTTEIHRVATNAAALTYMTAPTLPTTYAASDARLGTAVSVATPSGTMTRWSAVASVAIDLHVRRPKRAECTAAAARSEGAGRGCWSMTGIAGSSERCTITTSLMPPSTRRSWPRAARPRRRPQGWDRAARCVDVGRWPNRPPLRAPAPA